MNPQAEELNKTIKNTHENIFDLLSEKGKAIFFPKKGILAQTAQAKGKKINATIGIALEEDGTPMRLTSIAEKIKLAPGEAFPYAPSFGKPELRRKWKEMLYQKNPSLQGREISLPVTTNALTHGLSILGYLFMDPEDKVIMPELFWGNYKLIFLNAYSVKFDLFKTFDKNEGGLNVNGLKEKLGGEIGKKIILLNFPNNPTGYTVTEKEAEEIVAVIKEAAERGNKIVAILDDAYFGLVYKDGIYTQSLFSELADIHENVLAVKVDGATKEDYVWGFRVGFITYGTKGGNKELYSALESKTAGAIRGSISNDSHLSQSLVYHAFSDTSYSKEKQEKFSILKKRFETVEKVLEINEKYKEKFLPLPHNSGYFMCVKLITGDAERVRQVLLEKYDTGVIAMGTILRIAFSAVKTESIPELFENIYQACSEN